MLGADDLRIWGLLALLTAASAAQAQPATLHRCSAAFWRRAVVSAAAAEFLGAALDLIDDVQDGDSPFVAHVGTPIAVNAGLTLLQLSLGVLDRGREAGWSYAAYAQGVFILNSLVLTSLGGQFLDLAFERRSHVTLEQAMTMTEQKSGALLALVAELGALASVSGDHLPAAYLEAVGLFGWHLGTWGQVLNDEQDALPAQSSAGKSDRARQKKTVPLVLERYDTIQQKQRQLDEAPGPKQALDLRTAISEVLRLQAQHALEALEARFWPHPLLWPLIGV